MLLYSKYEVVAQEFRNRLLMAKKTSLSVRYDGKYVVHP
jgi:hypothetical protein